MELFPFHNKIMNVESIFLEKRFFFSIFSKNSFYGIKLYIMYLNVDRQGCVIKTVAYSLRTDSQTDGRTEKSLKAEGSMILSIDIFYFNTVIIGGPIIFKAMRIILRTKKEGIYQGTGCNSTKYIDLICS